MQSSVLIHYYMINNMVCCFVEQQENDGGGETQVPTENANKDYNAFTSFIELLTVV